MILFGQILEVLIGGLLSGVLYSLVALVKLRFWLLIRLDYWRFLPAPCLHDVQQAAGLKGMESYDKLKTATSFLFLELGQRDYEQLMHNL